MHTSWSHDCRIEAAELLDHAEADRARRDRGHRPQRLRRRARGGRARRADRDLDRDPGRGGQDRRPGRGDRPLPPARRSRAACPFADTIAAIREQGGLVYLPHPFDRMHAIPDAGDAAPAPGRDRRLRGLQRAPAVRGVQRRGAPLRAQVRPDDGRRLGRARPPGRRHRRAADAARSRGRRSSCSACAAPRCCGGRGRSCTCSRSSGWPRPRNGSARPRIRTRPGPVSACVDRRDLREVPAKGDLRDQRARATRSTPPRAAAAPVLGSGHPLADVLMLKYRRSPRRCRRASRSSAAPARRSSSRCSGCASTRWPSTARTASSSRTATRRRRSAVAHARAACRRGRSCVVVDGRGGARAS